jgi:hypothetical protein
MIETGLEVCNEWFKKRIRIDETKNWGDENPSVWQRLRIVAQHESLPDKLWELLICFCSCGSAALKTQSRRGKGENMVGKSVCICMIWEGRSFLAEMIIRGRRRRMEISPEENNRFRSWWVFRDHRVENFLAHHGVEDTFSRYCPRLISLLRQAQIDFCLLIIRNQDDFINLKMTPDYTWLPFGSLRFAP